MSIELRNVSKTFGSFRALDNLSMVVPDGQLVALLGPSGSGKTTLLRIIAGLEAPDARGETQIQLKGRNILAGDLRSRRVGFVFQHYALFRQMTVFENVAFGLKVRPRAQRPPAKEIHERVMKLLSLVQMENLPNRFPSQLSGGQRQRIALARALAVEPEVLLLDEPFGALDAKVRQELRQWLRRLHDEIHVTSVFVTHDQEEALEVSDRIVVMNHGRIEQEGTPSEVFHKPANEFVMNFLGHVNLFQGRIENGQAVFGTMAVDCEGDHADGKAARLFVRPHDLTLSRVADANSLLARVERIHSAGPIVKVELLAQGSHQLQVDVTHEQASELAVEVGHHLFVRPRNLRVFVEDYTI